MYSSALNSNWLHNYYRSVAESEVSLVLGDPSSIQLHHSQSNRLELGVFPVTSNECSCDSAALNSLLKPTLGFNMKMQINITAFMNIYIYIS